MKSYGLLVLLAVVWQQVDATDRITITKVEARHTSKGTSAAGDFFLSYAASLPGQMAGFGLAGIAAPVTFGVKVPFTVSLATKVLSKGPQESIKSLRRLFESKGNNSPDDLYMVVNGVRWSPKGETSKSIGNGQAINPNFKVDFNGEARITLWEYDWGSGDDNLGTFVVNAAAFPAGNFAQDDVIVISKENQSLYLVSYKVERNVGNAAWLLCGTRNCKPCNEARCRAQSISGLDRDKDHSDLKGCPSTHNHHSYRKYDQIWPAADVYLRICQPK